ncbi:DUF4199 domain-containing protein [Aquirufa antheringensis]|jgi:hypothetical protein|uniref:DUF4199 domain-containing protein n=1 Tax=Aquirufa antheringensis TaxID=2516559 RepID=A0A4Q9BBC1_9BACT|nr:DUF4199 domain-containing protein [Aquirufa antheringensis]MCE4216611.1 DUF4199 family protein [Pseudarcicella sp. GAP-15]MCL9968423.1 DUF4199 domain-containing protein [Aquirufa antheringensis]MCZ2476678.1 DUF4199 domain-containing protein [Aquirufa antheringensis]MCZ2486108.1 DUF4199 domain-containing protein [Aquirufa antheringensis]MCZ2486201.1 DUF4199 domain-containing protein [Aquirufa antheringensis]
MENTSESTASSSIIALKYGFINGLLSFLFSTLANVMGWAEQFQESMGWISGVWSLVLSVTVLYLCLREYREQNAGFISYGKGLGLATLLGAISGLVAGGFNYIYIQFIDNTVIQRQMDIARERMEDQGMSASQIQSAEEMTAMFMNPGMQFVIVVIMSVIFNFLLGLIVSAVVKREKPVFE